MPSVSEVTGSASVVPSGDCSVIFFKICSNIVNIKACTVVINHNNLCNIGTLPFSLNLIHILYFAAK
jgi:hypothetical protein